MPDHFHRDAFGAPATGWGLTAGTARAPSSWPGHPQPIAGTKGRPGFGRDRDAAFRIPGSAGHREAGAAGRAKPGPKFISRT